MHNRVVQRSGGVCIGNFGASMGPLLLPTFRATECGVSCIIKTREPPLTPLPLHKHRHLQGHDHNEHDDNGKKRD